ncbi:MAG TPA: hypothetical protein VIH22_12400 [Cyclobacteriaceae bacterium]|jgi:hypothetical protein
MKWKVIVILSALVVVSSFSLIFVPHVIDPKLFSFPYILWTGLLTTLLLVFLTYLGTKNFPYSDK